LEEPIRLLLLHPSRKKVFEIDFAAGGTNQFRNFEVDGITNYPPNKKTVLYVPGLPDFNLVQQTKRGKMYQITTKFRY
jgi:hypothetical protein